MLPPRRPRPIRAWPAARSVPARRRTGRACAIVVSLLTVAACTGGSRPAPSAGPSPVTSNYERGERPTGGRWRIWRTSIFCNGFGTAYDASTIARPRRLTGSTCLYYAGGNRRPAAGGLVPALKPLYDDNWVVGFAVALVLYDALTMVSAPTAQSARHAARSAGLAR